MQRSTRVWNEIPRGIEHSTFKYLHDSYIHDSTNQIFAHTLSLSLSSRVIYKTCRANSTTRERLTFYRKLFATRVFPPLPRNKIGSPAVSPGFVYTWANGEGRGGRDVRWNLSGKETIALERGSSRRSERRSVVFPLPPRIFFPLIRCLGYSSRIKPTDDIYPSNWQDELSNPPPWIICRCYPGIIYHRYKIGNLTNSFR